MSRLMAFDHFGVYSAAARFQDVDTTGTQAETCTNAPIEDLPMVSYD